MTFEPPFKCRDCGSPIVFGETAMGKMIPMDVGLSVFKVVRRESGGRRRVERVQGALVKHRCGKGKR